MGWSILAFIAGKAKSALSWALGLIRDNPWPVACAGALLLSWGLWNGKTKAVAERDAARFSLRGEKNGREDDRAKWANQVADAIAARKAAERKSQEIATDAQVSHAMLAADVAGLRSFIVANRLRAESHPAAAAVATDDHGAAVPDATAAVAFVATSEADLVTCDALYAYARPAYEWAQGLIAKGLAAPPDP